MRKLIPILALLVLTGVACTDSGGDEVAASFDAVIVPDESCRNNAVAESEHGRWRVMGNLPLEWRGRIEVHGVIEKGEDGSFSFVADGVHLAATDNMIAPSLCVPWEAPTPASDS